LDVMQTKLRLILAKAGWLSLLIFFGLPN